MRLASEDLIKGIPVSLVERYRTADGPALKVALYLLFGNACAPEQIAADLGLPMPAVERSLDFWFQAGLLAADPPPKPPEPVIKKKGRPPGVERRMPITQIAQCLRNPEIAALLQEAQAFLGRTLTQSESERLLCIYEFDEFPVDVILMMVAYGRKHARRNMFSFVERLAREWKEDGIDTSGKAEKRLELLAQRDRQYRRVAEILETDPGVFTFRDRQQIDRWFEEYGYDGAFVMEACLRNSNRSVSYIHKILTSWSQKGYTTTRETRAERQNTAAPQPERRGRKKKADDLVLRALKETNGGVG